jgi:hypothetical protein
MIRALIVASALLSATSCGATPTAIAPTDARSPLRLERTIPLPDTKGRIDHLAVDLDHRQLFVAEYGNSTVDEVDLASGHVVGRIAGLHEPQGVAYLPAQAEIVIACGDGTVHFYRAADRHEVARIDLGDDADNVRVDARNGHVIVGYGSGGLATIDPVSHQVLARMALPGHPEGFRLAGAKVLINVPDRGEILSGNVDTGVVQSTWPTGAHHMNFPLAIAPDRASFAVVYRLPATLAQYDGNSTTPFAVRSTCGDADDLFLDGDRLFVVCGAGHVDVMPVGAGAATRVSTASGARTGLFVPELHTLFVATPARSGPAAIWVLDTSRR